jgi:hypothetical protein
MTAKEPTKRAEALKPDGETDVGDRTVGGHEKTLCLLKSLFRQMLVGRPVKKLFERAEKMIRRETRYPCHIL